MIKQAVSLIVGIIALATSVYFYVSQPKVAYVRSEVVFEQYEGMKEAMRVFQEKKAGWQSNMDTLNADYQRALSKYNLEANSLTVEQKIDREKTLRSQLENVSKYAQLLDSKAGEEDQKLTQGVINQIDAFIKEYCKARGYDKLLSKSDYYPFGWEMPGRKFVGVGSYRYGFNGKEKDDEIKGEGNSYDYGARMHDPRIGRWSAVDRAIKSNTSSYVYTGDNPIIYVDPDGNDKVYFYQIFSEESTGWKTVIEKDDNDEIQWYIVEQTADAKFLWAQYSLLDPEWEKPEKVQIEWDEFWTMFTTRDKFMLARIMRHDDVFREYMNDKNEENARNGDAMSDPVVYWTVREYRENIAREIAIGLLFLIDGVVGIGAEEIIITTKEIETEAIILEETVMTSDLAFGLNEGLEAFAEAKGFKTYREFTSGGFQKIEIEAAIKNPENNLHFNLDGFSSIQFSKYKTGDPVSFRNITNWELRTISETPGALGRTTFYRNGEVVGTPSWLTK